MLTGNVHGHLLNLGAVELLNLAHHADIVGGDEVDGHTLATETTTTTDTVDVVLAVGGKVVVDDKGDLLDVDTTGEEVSGDQDTGRTGTELLHDNVTLGLVHVTVHGGDGEVTGSELVGEPVNLSAGVAEDNGLSDGDGLVQVGEGVELPVLLLNGNVELLDTFEGKLVLLDEDTDGVAHELGGDLEDVLGHGGGEQDNLGALGEELEDVVDLLGETAGQHLVGLVEAGLLCHEMANLTLIIRHAGLLMGQRTYIFPAWSMDPGSRPGCSESQRKNTYINEHEAQKIAIEQKVGHNANAGTRCAGRSGRNIQSWYSVRRSKTCTRPHEGITK